MKKTYKTLVISPHCDDEVLACGGMLNNRQDSKFVYYMGIDIFINDIPVPHVGTREQRIKEVEAVSRFLNFDYVIGSNRVNCYKKETMINEITDVINELKPEEIFIPNPAYNQDHQQVYESCLVALRPHDLNHFVPNIYVCEVDQYLLWGENKFEPNYFEAIDIEKKIDAYLLHASQVRSFRPPELIRSYGHIRGLSAKMPYAEGFKILRQVKS